MGQKIKFCGVNIAPGEKKRLELFVGKTYDFIDMRIPIVVIRGNKDGPRLFLSAAIHGDEVNGTEIIRRILQLKELHQLSGTLVCVPIVNVFGFNNKTRYFPDGRDLNRSFPGSVKGSLASRVARLFYTEIVKKCTHGIDLHTGARERENYPQIRACLADASTKKLAKEFGAPIILDSTLRDGSLRDSARKLGVPILLYEGGQALRFNPGAIECGVAGIISVMRKIGMLPRKAITPRPRSRSMIATTSSWIRASQGGLLVKKKFLGDHVKNGDVLGVLSDPFGENSVLLRSDVNGRIIGISHLPLVNQGDAVFHLASLDKTNIKNKTRLLDSDWAY